MLNTDELLRKIMNDLRVELSDEFDKNFVRKAFFTEPWPDRKSGSKGTLMNVRGGGGLRGSIRSSITGRDTITWTSSQPQADIHNSGGEITVTAKMISFFWAKYYELSGQIKHKKNGTQSTSRKNLRISREAEMYKSLALKKPGDKIVMPKRQFIGAAPEVDQAVGRVIDANLKHLEIELKNLLKQR
jgi:phage gpG-like protein